MIFKKIPPSNALQPYVKNFWFIDSEGPMVNEEVLLPSGYVQLAFNLGKATWQSKQGGVYKTDPNLELRGQHFDPAYTKMVGHDIILGISFYPHTVCCFINEKAAHFSNCVMHLDDVFGKEVKLLYEMLLSVDNLIDRVKLLESFLVKRLKENRLKGDKIMLLDHMVGTLAQGNHTNTSLKQAIDKTGYSERYIQRLFNEYIGVSPKALQKIYRFHESLRLLNKSPDMLISVAYDCGYADQAHFTRVFKSFTGITPSAYQVGSFPSALGFL